jgi:hypothetical protein
VPTIAKGIAFQPFLRFWVETLVDLGVPRDRAVFQPFLRFWEDGHIIPKGQQKAGEGIVSTLLEILEKLRWRIHAAGS